jgi:multiple sugar transport system substrate-binding protein
VVAASKNKVAAEQFVSYLLSPVAQLAMTQVGQLSVRQDLRSQLTAIHTYYGTFLEQLATAKARTPVANYAKIDSILGIQVAKAMTGKETAQKAMDEAAVQIDPLLR